MTDSLYGRLQELGNSDFYPFHMPGHKRNVPEGVMSAWYAGDITEIVGFDNLHQPEGILLHAQQKAADLYQAEETFFLINGSTGGVLSALSAVAKKRKKVLISRNSHISAYHAAYLQGMDLEYLYPDRVRGYSFAGGLDAARVEERLRGRKDIGAVFITSPTYEGISCDVRSIAEAVHRHHLPLIVDQAHGAHFGFHPAYPPNAVGEGADLVIHSLHKTLPAPTQTALLHVQGERVDRKRLKRYLRVFQSSSPSYPLMAGMDLCLELLRDKGSEMMKNLLDMRHSLTEMIKDLNYIKLCDQINDPAKAVIWMGETKPPHTWLTGYRLAEILRERYHLEMELAAEDYVIAIFSVMDQPEGIRRLGEALCEIDKDLAEGRLESGGPNKKQGHFPNHPLERAVGIRKALEGMSREVDLEEAVGQIAAEFVFLYPPGIPLAVPGERLDRGILEMMAGCAAKGLALCGLPQKNKIVIMKEK